VDQSDVLLKRYSAGKDPIPWRAVWTESYDI